MAPTNVRLTTSLFLWSTFFVNVLELSWKLKIVQHILGHFNLKACLKFPATVWLMLGRPLECWVRIWALSLSLWTVQSLVSFQEFMTWLFKSNVNQTSFPRHLGGRFCCTYWTCINRLKCLNIMLFPNLSPWKHRQCVPPEAGEGTATAQRQHSRHQRWERAKWGLSAGSHGNVSGGGGEWGSWAWTQSLEVQEALLRQSTSALPVLPACHLSWERSLLGGHQCSQGVHMHPCALPTCGLCLKSS